MLKKYPKNDVTSRKINDYGILELSRSLLKPIIYREIELTG